MPVVWPAVGACVLPNVGGWFGAFFVARNIDTWYAKLKKPVWCPPNRVFGPVWTGLYSSMGYASYLVWRDGGGFEGDARLPLALYGSQLVLNWAWTPIFFGSHNIGLSLLEIGVLWGNAAACGYYFFKINPIAGYIFIPYMAWLTLATALTYSVWRENSKEKEAKD
ncbi:translocator protein-like [Schistocerca americana]|uniref:translocator protein-like n=1 Tax=Schistocerca americana TaxID=7009 RepID=UPI001F502A74|nr:translocator protein-like [Schistocerca americana]XP_049959053.1 translocator protein-like [Schistocerca serialis cubense]